MRKSYWAVLACGCSVAVAASCTTVPEADDRICTPKANVFCRCEDKEEGTKRCNESGTGFAECKCLRDEGDGPVFDEDAGFDEVDSGPVDKDSPKIDVGCKGKIGLMAGPGGATDIDLYAGTYEGDGVFKVVKSSGPALRSPATVVPIFGADTSTMVAVWQTRLSALGFSTLTAGTWSPPFSIGNEFPATSTEPPALVSYQVKTAVLAYASTDTIGYERFWSTTKGWLDTEAAARPINEAGAAQKGLAIAAIREELHAAYVTKAGGIAVESKVAGAWAGTPVAVAAAGKAFAVTPALVPIDPTGTLRDLLLVFVGSDQKLQYAVRSSNSKTWSSPKLVDVSASPTDGLTLAPMVRGRAILAWRGANKHGFTSQFDVTKSVWSPPQEIATGGAAELASVPVVAESRCGGADATVIYALLGGTVGITRYKDGAAQGPYPVGGITNASFVGVGETP